MGAKTIRIEHVTDDGDTLEHELPAKYEVCSRCNGEGTHVNEAIDGNGITASEWAEDWDDDSREAYMRGDYDVACTACNGDRVVLVVDEAAIEHGTAELKQLFADYCEAEEERAADRAMQRAEERAERGYCLGGRS